jgi:FkbM family methyltransferase
MPRGTDFCNDVAECLGKDIEVIFDIGATVGKVTQQLRDYFPSAQIYSFEPVGPTFEHLRENTKGLRGVECFNIGFSDLAATYLVFLQLNSGWNSIEKNIDSGRGSVEITTNTVDSFCVVNNILKIDLLKTDTEGHDLRVLQGAEQMLDEQRIQAVYSEVGFYKEDIGHTNFCSLLEFMQKKEYQIYSLYPIASTYIADPVNPDYPWANALFIRNDIVRAKYAAPFFNWLRTIGILPNEQG